MNPKKFYFIFFPSVFIIIMWMSKGAEYFFDLDFKTFGIFPQKIEALKGIILTPFIHENFNHLLSNTFPFFFLSLAIFYFYRKQAYRVLIACWFLTNFAVWLGGRFAWHIGASGLVYAFASFLFFAGILGKDRRFIAISLLVIFLYGGMIWGIFPGKINVSWESHLFGFLSGFIVAFYWGKQDLENPSDKVNVALDDFEYQSNTSEEYNSIVYGMKEEE